MQNEIKFQKNMIYLILNVIFWIAILLISLSNNNIFAEIHEESLSWINNHTAPNQSPGIQVGKDPKALYNLALIQFMWSIRITTQSL